MAYRSLNVFLTSCAVWLATFAFAAKAYADVPEQAWWLQQTYTPNHRVANGIAVKKYNPNWVGIRALSSKDLPSGQSANTLGKFRFVLRSDANGNGVAEAMSVGVYRDTQNQTGRYLAITERGRVLKTFSKPGMAGFSALLNTGRDIRWYFCMDCEDFETIVWTGDRFVLQ